MTTIIDLNTIESLSVHRTEDEYGWIEIRVVTEDGTSIRFTCGQHYDDAATIRDLLAAAHAEAESIVKDWAKDWKDIPDETDAFVFFDSRDGYLVQLEGLHWNGEGLLSINKFPDRRWRTFPTREIATYELAVAMAEAGCFPNAWYQDERGWSDEIDDDVRKHHDAGGDKMLPLSGVEYDNYAEVIMNGSSASVIRDYGDLGITYVLSGDDERRYSDDRALFVPISDDGGAE